MQTCKTCRWWTQDFTQERTGPELLALGYGNCTNGQAPGDFYPEWAGDGPQIAHGDFGCIHHTPKEDGDE